MEIRNRAELDVLYPEPQAGIMYDSPELLLMRRVAENDAEGAASLFREKRQFFGRSAGGGCTVRPF